MQLHHSFIAETQGFGRCPVVSTATTFLRFDAETSRRHIAIGAAVNTGGTATSLTLSSSMFTRRYRLRAPWRSGGVEGARRRNSTPQLAGLVGPPNFLRCFLHSRLADPARETVKTCERREHLRDSAAGRDMDA